MRICNIQIKIYGLKMLITFERIFLGQIFLSRGFGYRFELMKVFLNEEEKVRECYS